ncbi:MAG: M13 family peptidase [Nevskiaceae bacterium]|nr:MAG: M13 family peptidase [Nevskiaceae bacterium]
MMKPMLGALSALALAACATQSTETTKLTVPAKATAPAPAAALVSGIEPGNADAAVRPQDDLYRAVDGQWLAKTEIPADKSNYGAFTQLADNAEAQLRGIIEAAAGKTDKVPGSDEQKVGDLYASFMDEKTADLKGVRPALPELQRVDALKSKKDIPALMAHHQRIGINTPLIGGVHQDAKDPTKYVIDFFQAGLGLPDRDYYLQDDPKFKQVRAQYVEHIRSMYRLAGLPHGKTAAKKILALETEIARAHWSNVEVRDAVKAYNPFDVDQLKTLSPQFDWTAFVKDVGAGSQKRVVISQPSYVTAFGKLLDKTSLETWKTYFRWRVLSADAPYLDQHFAAESFAFNGGVLNGIKEDRPRWKRGVALIENSLGESVGKIYVAQYFPPEAKQRMDVLVHNLLAAYKDSIDGLDWMGPETRKAAQTKLAKFTPKIGYPDKWRDYAALTIQPDDLVGNVYRASEFEYQRNINKLGQPIDRGEWGMTPQTVNAYYNPEMNEIVFPAAILQPPFFNLKADDAVNYGGIGAVIGHEISHGFDDQGSRYDGDGVLRDWWTADDRKNFEARTKALIEQYNQYEPVKGYKLNGAFTIGENIADLAGMTIAYKAYKLSLKGQEAPVIDGLTGDQRFFMGWAQVWRRKYREENLIARIKTDPHSPSEFRCNGVVTNLPGYYDAFGVKPGDRLYKAPEQRIKLW